MSLTLKFASLAIRTLAKPIGNTIKSNAREHERFRKLCVNFAQWIHRVDMRLKLGLLQDTATIERQIQREVKEAEAKRQRAAIPTVKTEEQAKAEAEELKRLKKEVGEHVKAAQPKVRIRPLSEAKAIESGANFIAESFLFAVAAGLILFESWRRDRKEKGKDADVMERLEELEKERLELTQKIDLLQGELSKILVMKPFASGENPVISKERTNHNQPVEKPEASSQPGELLNATNTKPASLKPSSWLQWLPFTSPTTPENKPTHPP